MSPQNNNNLVYSLMKGIKVEMVDRYLNYRKVRIFIFGFRGFLVNLYSVGRPLVRSIIVVFL